MWTQTPLMIAASLGHIGKAAWLLDNKADIDIVESRTRYTPLMYASMHRQYGLFRFLVERGANLDQRDFDGWTVAMHLMSGYRGDGDPEFRAVMDYALTKGLNILGRCLVGNTVLLFSASTDMLGWFLSKNALQINLANNVGYTPLKVAMLYNKPDNVKLLIQWGAQIDEEVCRIAQTFGYVEVADMLSREWHWRRRRSALVVFENIENHYLNGDNIIKAVCQFL
jgi:ankyrin repeat protein